MKRKRLGAIIFIVLPGIVVFTGCGERSTISEDKPGISPGTAQTTPRQPQTGQNTQESAGLSTNLRQAKQRVVDEAALKNFALAYFTYFSENGRGPSGANDLKGSLDPKMEEALKDGDLYVVNWKLSNVSGSTVIAYVKEPDAYGTRLVARGDGSVTRMAKEDFEKAKTGR
jgi:hypothetical protein